MERKIRTYCGYFEAFMETLTEDQRRKVNYGILLLKTVNRLPAKFVKHIEDGIYELRTEYEGNVVVLFNGFQKKSQKTPKAEIDKAKQLKKAYYERTR